MVSVSLLNLVSIANTRPAWPTDFADKVAKLDENPAEKTAWGVIADWCDEHGEPELGRAFRWVGGRRLVEVRNSRPLTQKEPHWTLDNLPAALSAVFPQQADRRTLPGLMADLAAALEELDNTMK
jgi:uncharacterized protein (TIGR02996 family)